MRRPTSSQWTPQRTRRASAPLPARAVLLWLASLALAAPAAAQLGTGTLSGRVVDASSGEPLEDVVVSASSPALQGEQTVVTDASGSFRLPALPPGTYQVHYEAEGHLPLDRTGIELRSTATLRIDAQLLPETLAAEEVTVVATPPTVDIGSTRTGVTISSEFTQRIPVAPPTGKGGAARSFEQLAEIAPTGNSDRFGSSVSGSSSVENQYMIDGLGVNDPGFGFNATPLSIDFIKETNIVTGGYLPEYGRSGGGVLDVVTKSGSNTLHGSVFGNVSPWQASPKSPLPQVAINTTNRLDSVRDIGFDLGGPIVKDKLWFYVGADLSRQSYTLTRTLHALTVGADGRYVRNRDGLALSDILPGTRRKYLAEQTSGQYLAKLTYSPSDNDRLELNHRGTPTRGGGDGRYAVDYATGVPTPLALREPGILGTYEAVAVKQVFDSFDTSLKWTRTSRNKRLTFDTIVGWHKQRTADLAADGTLDGEGLSGVPRFVSRRTDPLRSITEFEAVRDPSLCVNTISGGDPRCPVATYAQGGPGLLQDRHYNRYQGREVMTLVARALGHHVIKAGIDLEYMTYASRRHYSGGSYYRESTSGTTVSDYRRYGGLTSPEEVYTTVLEYDTASVSVAGFLQDSWSIVDRVTLNAGIRYDAQFLFADQGIGLNLPNQWSPRLGFIFDPTQQGRSKLFASYARYYQQLPLNIMSRAASGEPRIIGTRTYDDCNPGNPDYPRSCEQPGNQVALDAFAPSQHWVFQGGRMAIDPDLKPQSSTEITAGAEYEIIRNGRLGVTYVRRWMNSILEDMSRDDGTTYFLGTPGKGIASDFPDAKRIYDAGILSFTKTFSDHWLAQASYTLSHLRGNWEGLFRAQTGQLDPGTNSDFDLLSLLVNRYGDLPADRRHELKLFGARDFDFSRAHHLNVGASYRARSGAPTNYFGSHITYGTGEAFILPRGAGERMPWLHNVDLHVGYTFLQTRSQLLSVTADVFNLLNLKAVVRRGQNYTNREVLPITGPNSKNPFVRGNKREIEPARIPTVEEPPFQAADKDPSFGAPLEYQAPITLRFGVKSTF